jgi:hypothetical protein
LEEADVNPEHEQKPQMTIEYEYNRRTGKVQLMVDFISSPRTWQQQHEEKHFMLVQRLLEKSGLLRDNIQISIRRDNVQTLYDVSRRENTWNWKELQQTSLAEKQTTCDEEEQTDTDSDQEINTSKHP